MPQDRHTHPPAPQAASAPTESSRPLAPRPLAPAAQRALAEAEERRRRAEEKPRPAPEIGGRGGPDPARYGDWEVNGIASDF